MTYKYKVAVIQQTNLPLTIQFISEDFSPALNQKLDQAVLAMQDFLNQETKELPLFNISSHRQGSQSSVGVTKNSPLEEAFNHYLHPFVERGKIISAAVNGGGTPQNSGQQIFSWHMEVVPQQAGTYLYK